MDVSKYLAKVIGIYLIIINLAMLMNISEFIATINSMLTNTPLMFVLGIVTLFIGTMMVVAHNIWTWNWRVIVTIMAWITLLKGAAILCCPDFSNKTTMMLIENVNSAYIGAVIDLALGVVLCYFGFRKKK